MPGPVCLEHRDTGRYPNRIWFISIYDGWQYQKSCAFHATHVHVTISICATWEEINHTWVTCTMKTTEWATALSLTKHWASWSANVSCEGNEEHEPPSTVSLCSVPARPEHLAHPLGTNKLELFSYLGRTLSRLLIVPVSKLYSIIYYF